MSEGHQDAGRMQRMVGELTGRNLWNEILEMRDRQRADLEKSVWLIKGIDRTVDVHDRVSSPDRVGRGR